ncbi:MAG: hypothetical protein ACOYMN_23385 [Roseimicrobium sp.]
MLSKPIHANAKARLQAVPLSMEPTPALQEPSPKLDMPGSETPHAAADYAQEYDQAVLDLRQEQNEGLNLNDTIKTLFMWVETPEERVGKNREIRTDGPLASEAFRRAAHVTRAALYRVSRFFGWQL